MTTSALRTPLLFLGIVAVAPAAAAQSLGTFSWQLTPYCNVLTLAVTQTGSQYRLEGYDDQCGAGPRAAVTGLVVPNPDGTLEFGLTIVTATSALPAHVDVTFTIPTLGGTWRDQTGVTGAFVFNPAQPAAGSPRPAPLVGSANVQDGAIGAADVNPAEVQRRVSGACSAGTFVRSVNADGTVGCGADSAGPGGITGVTAGPGLTGGGTAGSVGLAVAFAGPGITNLAARSDHTHSDPLGNTSVGTDAMANATSASFSTAVGVGAMGHITDGYGNTALGFGSMFNTTTGLSNVAVGRTALVSNETGDENTAVGTFALYSGRTANRNTAIGYYALFDTAGSGNIAVGERAGSLHQNGFNNVYIDHLGEASESNAIRIGTGQVETYIAGISGRTSSGGTTVFINSLGKLGTTTSSRRFKEQIAPLEDVSARVQALRPVTFFYKPAFDDGTRIRQYGLIAEEVDEVLPDLVVRDEHGQVETVRYHFLNTLLLAEVQRLERERAQQAREIAALRTMVEELIQRR